MHLKSWLPRFSEPSRVVAGLDVSANDCQLVILSGSPTEANVVCCAERLDVPEGVISQGQIIQPELLGQWLREHLEKGGYEVDDVCLGVHEHLISKHQVTVASGLSDEDVAFQLSMEMQELLPAMDACMDFQLSCQIDEPTGVVNPELQTYQVHSVSRSTVMTMSRMAHSAGLHLAVIEGRHDAEIRVQDRKNESPFPAVSLGLALQYAVAFGLALGFWQVGAINFLPHRARDQDVMRHAWHVGMLVWATGGMFFVASLTWALSAMVESKQSHLENSSVVARELDKARQAHEKAQGMQRVAVEQSRWFEMRQALHFQTIQWARVLNQNTEGLWINEVSQQSVQWVLKGEALTPKHAHVLLTHLKNLDIWNRPPELRQLEQTTMRVNKGLAVWQFQIAAELKDGV